MTADYQGSFFEINLWRMGTISEVISKLLKELYLIPSGDRQERRNRIHLREPEEYDSDKDRESEVSNASAGQEIKINSQEAEAYERIQLLDSE